MASTTDQPIEDVGLLCSALNGIFILYYWHQDSVIIVYQGAEKLDN